MHFFLHAATKKKLSASNLAVTFKNLEIFKRISQYSFDSTWYKWIANIQFQIIINFVHDPVARGPTILGNILKNLTVSDLSNILIPLSEISRTVHIGWHRGCCNEIFRTAWHKTMLPLYKDVSTDPVGKRKNN